MSNVHGWRSWLPQWRREESGVAEATAFIIFIPIVVSLLFVLIETGFNLRYRIMIDNIAQDAVRGVALDGGNNWPRTRTINTAWDVNARNRLYALCGATYPTVGPRCTKDPTTGKAAEATCTPDIADYAGQEVKCRVTFRYKPISPIASNPVTSLGFSKLFTEKIVVTVTSLAAVGKGA